MKQTVSKHDFREAFRRIGRENFSYEGLGSLFDYLEELGEDVGMEFELDPIAFCCEYAEYADIDEFNNDYDTDYEDYEDIEETEVISIDSDSFIILQF